MLLFAFLATLLTQSVIPQLDIEVRQNGWIRVWWSNVDITTPIEGYKPTDLYFRMHTIQEDDQDLSAPLVTEGGFGVCSGFGPVVVSMSAIHAPTTARFRSSVRFGHRQAIATASVPVDGDSCAVGDLEKVR